MRVETTMQVMWYEMSLNFPDRNLILKLFYVSSSDAAAALRKFRRVKRLHKGKDSLTLCSLRIVKKLQED